MSPTEAIAEWEAVDATRANVGTFIGIAGPTGSGKTWSALELATGLTPPGEKFVVIDTEHERARMYAEDFNFKHVSFNPPFSSQRYAGVIEYQIKAGHKVVVVDSASHEYMGEGGMHDEHDRILDEMVKRAIEKGDKRSEWALYDTYQWPAWREPKRQHKKFKGKLTRLPPGCHVILCFRAETKTEMATIREHGKEFKTVRPKEGPTGRDGWFPICEAALPYEMTLSFLVLADNPGVPLPIKAIPARLRPFFPLDKQLSRESGRLLADWSRGGSPTTTNGVRAPAATGPTTSPSQPSLTPPDARTTLIDEMNDLMKTMAMKDRLDLFEKHLGERTGAAIKHATVAQLASLIADVKTRSTA